MVHWLQPEDTGERKQGDAEECTSCLVLFDFCVCSCLHALLCLASPSENLLTYLDEKITCNLSIGTSWDAIF